LTGWPSGPAAVTPAPTRYGLAPEPTPTQLAVTVPAAVPAPSGALRELE
jgi:hypothetical protein